MTSAFVLGTRPEIIKLSPVIREYQSRGLEFRIIHTNQHYSPEMDAVFFDQLRLPPADINLGVGSGSHGRQLGKMLETLEVALAGLKPELVWVQGDTNSVLAGALMARRLGLTVAHVESGLRSYDRRMPEETNRILADHLADFLFAPTAGAREILLAEGIAEEKICVTGNTVVDALFRASALSEELPPLELRWPLEKRGYVLVTLHRPENVDNPGILRAILAGIGRAGEMFGLTPVFPVHPRTAARLEEHGISLPDSFLRLDALDYLSFIQLQKNSRLVITDSGGVQEEACILGVPCVTARPSTERPETVAAGANLVAGVETEDLVAAAGEMLKREACWSNPFGDGHAGERIVEFILGR